MYYLYDQQTNDIKYQHFSPDYDMAHSLQRLLDNNPMNHDILLLKNEALEAKLMDDPNSIYYSDYRDAHEKVDELYGYDKECKRLRKLGILPTYGKEEDD